MARFLPTKIERHLEQLYGCFPTIIKKSSALTYWKIIKLEHKLQVWKRYNQHHVVNIDPFRIHWVSPSKINHVSTTRFGNRLGPYVKGGDWDKNIEPFEERDVYISFDQRFNRNEKWENTPRYKHAKEKFEEVDNMAQKQKYGNYLRNLDQVTRIVDGLRKYDEMYKEMKKNRYKTQRELRSINSRLSNPGIMANAVPEYDEINVDIARDGTLLWYCGQHRLSLAKILNIDEIPVRIRCRHVEWQDKRDSAITDPDSISPKNCDHFDIPC